MFIQIEFITVLLEYKAKSAPKHKNALFSRYRYVHLRHFYFVYNLVINKTTDPTRKKRPSFHLWHHHSGHKFSRHRAGQFSTRANWFQNNQQAGQILNRPQYGHDKIIQKGMNEVGLIFGCLPLEDWRGMFQECWCPGWRFHLEN